MYSLDVIVPFYNEENFLKESVTNLINVNIHDKIYLVNNNSTDKSKEIALKIVERNSNITYLETSSRKGKGVGLMKAIEHINSTHTVIHDADLEYVRAQPLGRLPASARDVGKWRTFRIRNPIVSVCPIVHPIHRFAAPLAWCNGFSPCFHFSIVRFARGEP